MKGMDAPEKDRHHNDILAIRYRDGGHDDRRTQNKGNATCSKIVIVSYLTHNTRRGIKIEQYKKSEVPSTFHSPKRNDLIMLLEFIKLLWILNYLLNMRY